MTNDEIIRMWRMCQATKCIECKESIDIGHCMADQITIDDLVDRLEALIAENEHLREVTKMVWCNAEHEAPVDENQCVLASVSGMYENLETHKAIYFQNACEIATYNSRDGWILEQWPEWENPGVIHWMPLPEPPSTEDSPTGQKG